MKIKEWWNRWRSQPVADVIKHKHRFVVMDTDTYQEKFSFQLSGINLFVTVGITVIVLILLTTVLIAFTPLREWIPGYTNADVIEQTYLNARRVDSLSTCLDNQEWVIRAMRAALNGEDLGSDAQAVSHDTASTAADFAKAYRRSKEDSLLRLEVEREDNRYEVKTSAPQPQPAPRPASAATPPAPAKASAPAPVSTTTVSMSESTPAFAHLFFSPLKGTVIAPFSAAKRHLGVDIAGSLSQPVYAAYGGTVILNSFTSDGGHVIAIQHPGNVITVYRNNSVLLKRQGDVVRAGEPIAYVGNSAALELGPHLHFELWVNGAPVNPEEYISF